MCFSHYFIYPSSFSWIISQFLLSSQFFFFWWPLDFLLKSIENLKITSVFANTTHLSFDDRNSTVYKVKKYEWQKKRNSVMGFYITRKNLAMNSTSWITFHYTICLKTFPHCKHLTLLNKFFVRSILTYLWDERRVWIKSHSACRK